jgi:iron complex outermembrane receptor protein
MSSISRYPLLQAAVAGCLVSLASGVAMAQETAASAAESSASALEEIVVTAQFRKQALQNVPIAISAINQEMLEEKGVTNIAEAANLAPNVQLSSDTGNFGGVGAVFIRGIGQSDQHPAVDPGVGMYVNDIYYGVMAGAIFDLLDIDRVEVLRGPQGTLAGKNSIGGSVKLYSRRPGADTDGYVELGVGSRGSVIGRAAGNFTILEDQLYARLAVGEKHSNGYVDRLDYGCVTGDYSSGTSRLQPRCKIGEQGGKSIAMARASLLWTPNDRLENLLVADVVRDRSQSPATKLVYQDPRWTGSANYMTGSDYTNYENYLSHPMDAETIGETLYMPSNSPVDAWGISNSLDFRISDNLTLTSITGFRVSDVSTYTTLDASPASLLDQTWNYHHQQFTQELRLGGAWDRWLDWTVGAYFYHANTLSLSRIIPNGGLAVGGGGIGQDFLQDEPARLESKSLFAHTEWHLTNELSVIGAIRYTDDSKRFRFGRANGHGGSYEHKLPGLDGVVMSFKGDNLDYRAAINYDWTPNIMTYLQVATGYKGGGVNPRAYFVTQIRTYEPEKLTSYEAGFKTSFFDRRLILNGAIFHNKYDDFQSALRSCPAYSPTPTSPCSMYTNVGDAEIEGAELELSARPIAGLTIDASVGYLDFKYKKVDPASRISLDMTNVYTPEWTAGGGIQYVISAGNSYDLTPRVDVGYRSEIQGNAVNDVPSAMPGRALVSASVVLKNLNRDWQVEFSGRNLTDKLYYDSNHVRAGAPYFAGVGVVGEPRTFMLSAKKFF